LFKEGIFNKKMLLINNNYIFNVKGDLERKGTNDGGRGDVGNGGIMKILYPT